MPIDYDKYVQSGQYARFDNPGDQVVGVIKEDREGSDYNGNPCPELVIEDDDGNEITVTAGQVMLKKALAEQRPGIGDKIRITYTGKSADAKPGRAPAKLFTVEVKPGPHPVQNPVVADSEAPF